MTKRERGYELNPYITVQSSPSKQPNTSETVATPWPFGTCPANIFFDIINVTLSVVCKADTKPLKPVPPTENIIQMSLNLDTHSWIPSNAQYWRFGIPAISITVKNVSKEKKTVTLTLSNTVKELIKNFLLHTLFKISTFQPSRKLISKNGHFVLNVTSSVKCIMKSQLQMRKKTEGLKAAWRR